MWHCYRHVVSSYCCFICALRTQDQQRNIYKRNEIKKSSNSIPTESKASKANVDAFLLLYSRFSFELYFRSCSCLFAPLGARLSSWRNKNTQTISAFSNMERISIPAIFLFFAHCFFYKLSSYAVGAHCFVVCFMATKNRRNIKSNKKVIFCFRTFLFACTRYELTTQEKQVMESISCPINHVFRSRHPHPKHIKKLGLTWMLKNDRKINSK